MRPALRRTIWIVFLAGALSVAAGPSGISAQGTLPGWGRPLTPAQGRELRVEIARLSVRLGVRESTLFAIARVLGANLRDISFPELIEQVQAQAERAAHLQIQVAALQAQIASLSNAEVRNPAEEALARAVAAFAEGRLDDADREFATLESLRSAESEAARLAWLDAVDARARLAELRFDYDAAESLRVSAARAEQRAARLSIERQWLFMYEAALARYLQGEIRGDEDALERAVTLFRDEALPLAPRAERPYDWAQTQNDLGSTLLALGEREAGPARLRQAVAAFQAALQVRTPDQTPLDWSMSMNNLGNAQFRLGGREGRTRWFRQSAQTFQTVLEVISRERYPEEWATTRIHLANAFGALGERDRGTARVEQAVQLYRSALDELSRERRPSTWAMAQNNMSATLRLLGLRNNDPALLQQAANTYELVIQGWPRDQYPLRWALAQFNLALTLRALGERETGASRLEEAVIAFDAALQESTRERAIATWAWITAERADLIALICRRTRDCVRLQGAERDLSEAQALLRSGGRSYELGRVGYVLRRVRTERRRLAQ